MHANPAVLVVEDEKDIRESLQQALEYEGYIVYAAENGKQGLEMLPHMPRPGVILLDLMMPIMNGWEFANALHQDEKLSPIPVVVVSAFSDQAQTIPAGKFMRKPIDLDALLNVVKQYCSSPTS